MHPADDPFAEHLGAKKTGAFRSWMRRSNPVSALVAAGFALLIVAVCISMITGYYERRYEDKKTRSELECRSRFTNDVTQTEGVLLKEIGRLVVLSSSDNEKAQARQITIIKRATVELDHALAKRNHAESICHDRPAS